ncbi:dipeptide ABC transporter ATP-binding protein [Sulfolobus sp. E5-1-F]|uniref:ABC transporter ATP-binding protein n=1 Tax=Saccharolobus sp. E5-1-F TaxID=2663019 RepID=UPI001296B77E|nr:ABC transporter ATP-binding protein [Sulfolobus sp. E5-1-F]QGA55318.1 dipeptide ABC transporter ATP-binding protein [Sulfolobus sp. E5-1-F]
MADNTPLLSIRNLIAGYYTPSGVILGVVGVSFDIYENEILAIVGESGSGKSTLASAIYGILKYPGKVFHGEVIYNGQDLLKLDYDELRNVRMREISMVPQYAMDALNPVIKIGDFMIRALEEHGISGSEAEKRIKEKLQLVRLPEKVLNMYPHELSGGMRQRAVIATSLLLDPKLVILDEPTTGLDVIVQYKILKDLKEIQRKLGISVMIISHDLPLMMMIADRVGILYGGELVELGHRDSVLYSPKHPYSLLLLKSVPSLINLREKLLTIPGSPPVLLNKAPNICVFYDRCPFRMDICRTEKPRLLNINGGHYVRCFIPQRESGVDLNNLPVPEDYYAEEEELSSREINVDNNVVLKAENLVKVFYVNKGLIAKEPLYAVNDVSFELKRGIITALVGGSGHGKSTIARILAGIEDQTSGKIFLEGQDYSYVAKRRSLYYRSKVQMVFQDPYSSLDPRHTVRWHIERPLRIHKKIKSKEELNVKIAQILKMVGLKPPEKYMNKYPHELSGGERQRVAIARAISVEPHVLLADEPVSMLDASLRAGILNLLKGLKRLGMSILYITHDIATVAYIADEVMVIHNGKIVEKGDVRNIIKNPKHPYTQELIEAVPDPYKRI